MISLRALISSMLQIRLHPFKSRPQMQHTTYKPCCGHQTEWRFVSGNSMSKLTCFKQMDRLALWHNGIEVWLIHTLWNEFGFFFFRYVVCLSLHPIFADSTKKCVFACLVYVIVSLNQGFNIKIAYELRLQKISESSLRRYYSVASVQSSKI